MKTNFEPFPEIETTRLKLRKLTLTDAFDLFEIRSNPEMFDFVDGKVDEFIEDTIRFIEITNKGIKKQKWINFGIELKENKKLIGNINLWNFDHSINKAEVGFSLNTRFQRKGIMSEALDKVLDFGFNKMNLEKIELWTEKRNDRAIKLAEKNGFKLIREVFEKGYYKKQIFKYLVFELKKD